MGGVLFQGGMVEIRGRQLLVYLRKGETFAELGAGFGVSTTTAWRYGDETVTLQATRSPKLAQALRKAAADSLSYLVLDGTLIPIDRVAAGRPFYSGKHRKHGMNLQVIAIPEGDIVWVSGALPGSVHDLRAARIWGIPRALEAVFFSGFPGPGVEGRGHGTTFAAEEKQTTFRTCTLPRRS